MIESGYLERDSSSIAELCVPEGLRKVIERRAARLTPECRRVLTNAAVLGAAIEP
jgi:hypothetical protein